MGNMEVIFTIIESPAFRKWVISPLAVVGFYQIFRGVTTIIEKDLQDNNLKGWVANIYIAVTILGCICLVTAL